MATTARGSLERRQSFALQDRRVLHRGRRSRAGFAVSELFAKLSRSRADGLRKYSAGEIFLGEGNSPYTAGSILKQPALAKTLKRLADFGADDFLTVSLLARLYLKNWKAAITYQSITSRKFKFRYDLLSAVASKIYLSKPMNIQSNVGLLLKGDFGGESLQNGYHSFNVGSQITHNLGELLC